MGEERGGGGERKREEVDEGNRSVTLLSEKRVPKQGEIGKEMPYGRYRTK